MPQVDAVGDEVERLHAPERPPQERIDGAGEEPRVDRRDPGRLPVSGALGFSEARPRATEQQARHVVRHARVPELVARLALRDHVEVGPLDVGWAGRRSARGARGGREEGRAPGSARQRAHQAGGGGGGAGGWGGGAGGRGGGGGGRGGGRPRPAAAPGGRPGGGGGGAAGGRAE